jgi:hypothetical protein
MCVGLRTWGSWSDWRLVILVTSREREVCKEGRMVKIRVWLPIAVLVIMAVNIIFSRGGAVFEKGAD